MSIHHINKKFIMEKKINVHERFEKSDDQENLFANFVKLNDENHDYEEQSFKKKENEIFIEFIEIELICKRYEKFFSSKNPLHPHIRKALCLKQSKQVLEKKSKNKIKIIKSIAFTKSQDFELRFKN